MSRWQGNIALLAAALVAGSCATVRYSEDYDRQARFSPTGTYAWEEPTAPQREALDGINPFLAKRVERAVEAELAARGFVRTTSREAGFFVTAYALLPSRSHRRAHRFSGGSRSALSVGVGVGFRPHYALVPRCGFVSRHECGYGFPYPHGDPFFRYRHPRVRLATTVWVYRDPYFGYGGRSWAPRFGVGCSFTGGSGRPAAVGSGDRGPGTLIIEVRDARRGDVVWQGRADGALLDMPPAEELEEYVQGIVGRILREFPPLEEED